MIVLFLGMTIARSQKIVLKKIADLPEKLYETSGIAVLDDKIITHNDGGNNPEIYIITKEGKIQKTIKIEDAKNNDWEDFALDDNGRLYIGDVGDNLNTHESHKIYILPKGFQDKESAVPEEITFTYEDQKNFPPAESEMNFDCEAFICSGDKIYIFTKCRTKPFTGISRIYELSQKSGKQIAKKIGEIQLCKFGWQFCSVTSADFHEKSKTLVLLTYSRLYVIGNFSLSNPETWQTNVKSYQLPAIKQREAICFKTATEWYITDEWTRGLGGGNLYRAYLE